MPEHKGLYMLSHGIWPVHILKAMVIHQKEVIQSNKHIKKITFTARVRWGWGQSWQSGAGEELKHSLGKESSYNAGDLCSIPGLGRSPGEEKDYPLQHSKELDMTEWLSLHFTTILTISKIGCPSTRFMKDRFVHSSRTFWSKDISRQNLPHPWKAVLKYLNLPSRQRTMNKCKTFQ